MEEVVVVPAGPKALGMFASIMSRWANTKQMQSF
jgi:hypothetical protein